MNDMEHMNKRWVAQKFRGSWCVREEREVYWVARMCINPGDLRGERTARAICDQHNAALEAAAQEKGGAA